MKLKKMPGAASSLMDARPSPEQEAAFLRNKHLGLPFDYFTDGQKPLMGFGGAGRPYRSRKGDHEHKHKHHHEHAEGLSDEEKELLWAQMVPRGDETERILKGGHGVPLSGELVVTGMWFERSVLTILKTT